MPLPYDEGPIVPFRNESRRQKWIILPGFGFSIFSNAHPMTTGHQHRPTRHTNSATKRTRAIIPSKTKPLPRQSIKVRSLDMEIAMSPDRVGTLVICEEKDDVRPLRCGRCRTTKGQHQKEFEEIEFHAFLISIKRERPRLCQSDAGIHPFGDRLIVGMLT